MEDDGKHEKTPNSFEREFQVQLLFVSPQNLGIVWT
jgi:hypothetical protein